MRLAAAIELKNPPAKSVELQRDMLREVASAARNLLDGRASIEQQAKLVKALVRDLKALAKKDGGKDLLPMVKALERRILPPRTGSSASPPCSCGGFGPSVDSCCLCDLQKISDYVMDQVRRLYAQQVGKAEKDLPLPTYRIKCVASDSKHAYFGDRDEEKTFGVNAFTKVAAESAIVGIELLPEHIDQSSGAQTLYLLVHEAVCHAYQSFESVQRQNSDDTCAWSDGWMDALAWRLTERWLRRDSKLLPLWLASSPGESTDACERFHKRRYSRPECAPMSGEDLIQRQQARTSFNRLWDLWDPAYPTPERDVEKHRATQFSVLLNHGDIADAKRRRLIEALNTALVRRQGRSDQVAGVCSEFLELNDADRLIDDLNAINELPFKMHMT